MIISGQKGAVDNCQPPLCKNAKIRTKLIIYNKIQQTHWPFTPWQSHKALNKLQTQRLCWPASREFPLARRASVSSNLKNCDCWDLLSRQEPKLHRQVVQYRPCIDHVWPWVSWWIMVDIQCVSPHFYAHIQHNWHNFVPDGQPLPHWRQQWSQPVPPLDNPLASLLAA